MSKKDDFKIFVKNKPNLASFVSSGKMSWQKFYEIYDLYGENNEVWNEYERNTQNNSFKINDLIKNVNVDSVKEQINSAQKALNFVQELTGKTSTNVKVPVSPRPLNKFFED